MKPVKIKRKITPRYLLRLFLEGMGYLFSYLVKYLPWIALVVLFYIMTRYQEFRNYYCADLESTSTQVLNAEEVTYFEKKCNYRGDFYLEIVAEVQDYAGTGFRFALFLTALLVAIVPYVITHYYRKETFPPKTVRGTILVFLWWFCFFWLTSSIILYNPFYDWLKDIL